VPVMLLQPLIENAVKYGVYASAGITRLILAAAPEGNLLVIRIGNTYDPEANVKKGTGTGLANIRARLLNLYGTSSLIKISQTVNHFEVILSIPRHAR